MEARELRAAIAAMPLLGALIRQAITRMPAQRNQRPIEVHLPDW